MKKFVILLSLGLLLAGSTLTTNAQTINVSGVITSELLQFQFTPNGVSATYHDTWTGDIVGTGNTHIFSSVLLDPSTGEVADVVSKIFIHTEDGNLFLEGVGHAIGPFLHVDATIKHGTGIYKNAEGQSSSDGIIGPDGQVSNYTGTITFNP
jgi:hypothetical protein